MAEATPLKVIIGCEESGVVREAFRMLGHDAWSCDVVPARDDQGWHHDGINTYDVLREIHAEADAASAEIDQWLTDPAKQVKDPPRWAVNMDWAQFLQQKQCLVEVQGLSELSPAQYEAIEGLLNGLDAIGDWAADGYRERG